MKLRGILFGNTENVYIPFLDICYKGEVCCVGCIRNYFLPEHLGLPAQKLLTIEVNFS